MNEHTFLRLQDEVYKLQETVRELENKCFELFERQNRFNNEVMKTYVTIHDENFYITFPEE